MIPEEATVVIEDLRERLRPAIADAQGWVRLHWLLLTGSSLFFCSSLFDSWTTDWKPVWLVIVPSAIYCVAISTNVSGLLNCRRRFRKLLLLDAELAGAARARGETAFEHHMEQAHAVVEGPM